MTTHEAIAAMIAVDPKRTFCATKKVWHDPECSDYANNCRESYSLSAQPGVNRECSIYEGNSLEECVALATAGLTGQPMPTSNIE